MSQRDNDPVVNDEVDGHFLCQITPFTSKSDATKMLSISYSVHNEMSSCNS